MRRGLGFFFKNYFILTIRIENLIVFLLLQCYDFVYICVENKKNDFF